MDTRTFSLNVATIIATLAMVFAIMTSTTRNETFAFEYPKHCNKMMALLLQRTI